jgi:hypothetical protein
VTKDSHQDLSTASKQATLGNNYKLSAEYLWMWRITSRRPSIAQAAWRTMVNPTRNLLIGRKAFTSPRFPQRNYIKPFLGLAKEFEPTQDVDYITSSFSLIYSTYL